MKRYLKTPEETVKALKSGKEVIIGSHFGRTYKYKLIDGVICSWAGDCWILNDCLRSADKAYIDESEQFKLEVGKFYKTRNGRKAFVYAKTDTEPYHCWAVIIDSSDVGTFCCTANGVYTVNKESEKDLVAPWEE